MLAATSTAAVSFSALLSTVFKSTQALYAHPTNISSLPDGLVDSDTLPGADVIFPRFNEDQRTLSACLESIANQDYAGKPHVCAVDGSANLDAVRPRCTMRIRATPSSTSLCFPKIWGKRKAQIGAAMGQLTARNRSDPWLTRLIDMEYWLACNEECAVQARLGAVMCCCGAISPVRDTVFFGGNGATSARTAILRFSC
ncbi:hypothetical protein BZM26_36830 [Paraburkholderia strydomiana]|nr:hypothetical protein BZM26_36830 [Paraburkholderia strydomiana]